MSKSAFDKALKGIPQNIVDLTSINYENGGLIYESFYNRYFAGNDIEDEVESTIVYFQNNLFIMNLYSTGIIDDSTEEKSALIRFMINIKDNASWEKLEDHIIMKIRDESGTILGCAKQLVAVKVPRVKISASFYLEI